MPPQPWSPVRSPLGAQPDLSRLRDERRVLGLLRVGLHRDCIVADAFHSSTRAPLPTRGARRRSGHGCLKQDIPDCDTR